MDAVFSVETEMTPSLHVILRRLTCEPFAAPSKRDIGNWSYGAELATRFPSAISERCYGSEAKNRCILYP